MPAMAGAMTRNRLRRTIPSSSANSRASASPVIDGKGWLAGFHAGANWQDGRIVGGLEIDLSATGIQGSSNAAVGPNPDLVGGMLPTLVDGTARNSGRFEWLGSARAPAWLPRDAGHPAVRHRRSGLDTLHPRRRSAEQPERPSHGPAGQADGVFSSIVLRRTGVSAGSRASAARCGCSTATGSAASNICTTISAVRRTRPSRCLTPDRGRGAAAILPPTWCGSGLSYKFDPDRFALGYTGAEAPSRLCATPNLAAGGDAVDLGRLLSRRPWRLWLGRRSLQQDPRPHRIPDGAIFPPLSGVDSRGFVAGFHAGANWQSRSVVGGLELDISGTGIKGSTSSTAGGSRVTQNR